MKNLIKNLDNYDYSYKIVDDVVIIDHLFNLYIWDIIKMSDNVIFNNKGNIEFVRIKTITGNVVFNNTGYVYLESLEKITGTIEFGDNVTFINLFSLDISKTKTEILINLLKVNCNTNGDIKAELAKRSGLNTDMLL